MAPRQRNGVPVLLGLLLSFVAIPGCNRPTSRSVEPTAPPFSFRALDLRQRTSDGLPSWSLRSPQARYDLRSSVARALKPHGVIYEKGKPLYTLSASSGTVINDGAVIFLEGAIRLERLGENPLLVSADRALWIPRDSLMRFELGPQVRNLQNRLSARTATLHLEKDLLTIRGEPQLERWSRPFPLASSSPPRPPELQGTLRTVDWKPRSGELTGEGPLTIRRRPPGRAAAQAPQVLRAARLTGNTLRQEYILTGPVLVDDPAERSWFRGGNVTFNAREEWLKSAAAFQLQRGELQVQGEELRVDGKATTASIGRNCNLQQGADGLQSQSCQWNWKTQAVEAEGDVLFRRRNSDQLTRAQRLQGQLGSKGSVVATNPGGKVFSQLRVPRRAASPQPQKPRPRPEPIAF